MNVMATLQKSRIQEIEGSSSDLLDLVREPNGTVRVPVDLGKIAKHLNLSLKTAEFDDGNALGYLDGQTIYVAKNTPAPRTAFTIAHEMGHKVLHGSESDVYWRLDSLNLQKQDDTQETEANWFAASLLMPRDEVISWWKKNVDVEDMSQIFGVSRTAMTFRLKHLNLI